LTILVSEKGNGEWKTARRKRQSRHGLQGAIVTMGMRRPAVDALAGMLLTQLGLKMRRRFVQVAEKTVQQATRRQYVKYSRQGRGKAYSVREEARKQVHGDK